MKAAFEANGLPEPTTVYACGDDAVNIQIFNFVGPFLHKLANAGLTDYSKLITEVTDFVDTLPVDFKACLSDNQELAALGLKYGIDANTDSAAL